MISMPIIAAVVAIAWWDWGPGAEIHGVGIMALAALLWTSVRLLNVTIVEHSPNALRILRRGKRFIIPYEEVLSVSESGRFLGGSGILGTTHSRYVTVTLRREFAFGSAFSFYTRKEYGDFDGRSGPAKLIESHALRARSRDQG
jgi:hypothetical protein